MSTAKLVGNLLLQLLPGATPQTVPVGFEMSYTEYAMQDFSYATSQTNLAVSQGSVGGPRLVLVFLTEGTMSIGWTADGDGATPLTANPVPGGNDKPVWIMYRYSAPTSQLYMSCSAGAKGQIWVFE